MEITIWICYLIIRSSDINMYKLLTSNGMPNSKFDKMTDGSRKIKFLYAWSDCKEYARNFLTLRDPNKFKMEKAIFTPEQIIDFKHWYDYAEITNVDFMSGYSWKGDLWTNMWVSQGEYDAVIDYQLTTPIYDNNLESALPEPKIFDDNIQESLFFLGYYHLYEAVYYGIDDTMMIRAFSFNELNKFIELFGNTFKVGD